MSNSTPNLILPPNLQAQRAAEQREKELQEFRNRKTKLPPVVEQEVRKLLPQAREVHEKIQELLKIQAGWIALLAQESIRKILNDYMTSTIPQVVLEACKMDRVALLQGMQQIMASELTKAQAAKSTLDAASYQKAVSDMACVFKQAPLPPLNLQIALPEFDLDSPEGGDSSPTQK